MAGEITRRKNLRTYRRRLAERHPSLKHTIAFIDHVSKGYGWDQDVGELAPATTNETPEEERGVSVRSVAQSLSDFWNPGSKLERTEVRRAFWGAVSTGHNPKHLKVSALEFGFLRASEVIGSPASVRLSKSWKTDEDGKKKLLVPETELPWWECTEKLRNATLWHAGNWLVEEFGEMDDQVPNTKKDKGHPVQVVVDSPLLNGEKPPKPRRPGWRGVEDDPFGEEDH